MELSEAMTIVYPGAGDAPLIQIQCEICSAVTSVKVPTIKRVSKWNDFWFAMQRANRIYSQHVLMYHGPES